jgi:DNA repair protein RadA/Sms
MAKRTTTSFVCSNCGAVWSAWTGRCSTCGEWNTLQEEISIKAYKGLGGSTPTKLEPSNIKDLATKDYPRLSSSISDVDLVLGGGLVAGSVTLLTGQPGVGKSTILLQIANMVAKKVPVLYVSGEESAHQIALRAVRFGCSEDKLQIVTSNIADDVAESIGSEKYKLVIVDSIQTLRCDALSSAPGTISQITGSTQLLTSVAKQTNTAIILVGHVTKDGVIAGPKILEHMVDVVLQLDGDVASGFKVLRASKNRYGSTTEAGIFEMVESGLQPVLNPSQALLEERKVSDGSIVLATLEGTRPLLVEVQALVNPTSYGYPKRAASGIELNRLNLLIAMLERRTKLKLSSQDIYINIVGGIRIQDSAADLAICMAIGSASKGLQLKTNSVVFGEVGLSGEVRHVSFLEKRLSEAKKMGFSSAIGPMQRGGDKFPMLKGVADVRTGLNKYLSKDS